jgi:ABC-type amino acid transport substrate-binding protein
MRLKFITRLKYWIITLVAVLCSLGFPGVIQVQSVDAVVSEKPGNTDSSILAPTTEPDKNISAPITEPDKNKKELKKIKFGYIKDAHPVSYENRGVSGYCGKLKENLDQVYQFEKPSVIIPYESRFTRYQSVEIECSSNTISERRKKENLAGLKGEFSDPFFTTGAKLIIRNDKRAMLNDPVPSFKIGVIGKTTTKDVVSSIYPNAEIISDVTDRADALDRLKFPSSNPGYIDAYMTDEVLLESLLKELPEDDYSIEPKAYGFSHESYGVVVYDNDVLLRQVNQWIKSKEGQEARINILKSQANHNLISENLSFLLSQNYFFNLVKFLLVFFPSLFLLLFSTHPLLITLIAKLPLFPRFLSWVKGREMRGRKSVFDPFISGILHDETFNVVAYKANKTLVPMFVDRELVVALINRVSQSLIHLENGREPSTVEVEKVAKNWAQEAETNPHFTKVLETIKDAASEETEKWIRTAVTRSFELLRETVGLGGHSS